METGLRRFSFPPRFPTQQLATKVGEGRTFTGKNRLAVTPCHPFLFFFPPPPGKKKGQDRDNFETHVKQLLGIHFLRYMGNRLLRARPSPLSSLPRLRRGRKEDGKAAGAPSFPLIRITALHSTDGLAHRRRRRRELGFMCVFCLEEGGKKRGGRG